jgi:hypothetical protein
MHDPDANELIEGLVKSKYDITQLLPSGIATWESKIAGIDTYLRYLYKLCDSLVKVGNVRSERPLLFDWKLNFGVNANQYFQSNDVVFEIIMTLHQKVNFPHHFQCYFHFCSW